VFCPTKGVRVRPITPIVCFRSQQNRPPWPTKTVHGRKQGNGGTLEAAETINSYGLFESRWGEEPGGFFLVASYAARAGIRRPNVAPRLLNAQLQSRRS